MTTPDWLRQRGAELKLGSDRTTWYVVVAGKPLYDLVPTPASGKFSCIVRQTNNGQLIDGKGVATTSDEALKTGLDSLRAFLGW